MGTPTPPITCSASPRTRCIAAQLDETMFGALAEPTDDELLLASDAPQSSSPGHVHLNEVHGVGVHSPAIWLMAALDSRLGKPVMQMERTIPTSSLLTRFDTVARMPRRTRHHLDTLDKLGKLLLFVALLLHATSRGLANSSDK